MKQSSIKLIIFDLDGTTADTLGGITAAINRALTACGLPGHTEEGVRRFVNYGTSRFVVEAVPEKLRHDDALLARVTALYLDAYRDTYTMTEVYPGLPAVLDRLGQRTLLAMNSNKQDEFVGRLAEQLTRHIHGDGRVPHRPSRQARSCRCTGHPAPGVGVARMRCCPRRVRVRRRQRH